MSIDALAASASLAGNAGPLVAQQLLAGQHYYDEGQIDHAIAAYRNGLEVAAAASVDQIAAGVLAELHARLGDAYMASRRFGSAAAEYKNALRLEPTRLACWCSLGDAQLQTGNAKDAVTHYLEALKLAPAHWTVRINLARALMETQQHVKAKALLTELAGERPQDRQLLHPLGKVCFELNHLEEALGYFEEALAQDSRDADSLYWIGGIRQRMGHIAAARTAYAQAAKLRPLIPSGPAKSPASFRVLALFAPYAGNVPVEYLFRDAAYDVDTLALFDGGEQEAVSCGDVQLVVNLISDPDQAAAVLPAAARLAQKLGKPLINDPGKIQHTTRDAVAKRLADISGCRIPKVLRVSAGADVSAAALAKLLPFSCPVLARPAGTHGGDDFEKIADVLELSRLLGNRPDSDHYVTEYVDYASADGYFRKYRFIVVGDEILPYHLAIGNGWKVHHLSTEMASQCWMQREEAAFLAEPGAVFTAGNDQALRTIRERIGLDYFGIDCAVDGSGNIVVFEVNASMLVHDDNAEFPYKDAAVRAIKRAFTIMLHQRAASLVSAKQTNKTVSG